LQKTLEELACKENQLRCKLNANELQLKEQIVYNVSDSGIPGMAGAIADVAGTAEQRSIRVMARRLHVTPEAFCSCWHGQCLHVCLRAHASSWSRMHTPAFAAHRLL
jgi:hypothetical protein